MIFKFIIRILTLIPIIAIITIIIVTIIIIIHLFRTTIQYKLTIPIKGRKKEKKGMKEDLETSKKILTISEY